MAELNSFSDNTKKRYEMTKYTKVVWTGLLKMVN